MDTQHVFMCVDAGLIQYTVTDYILVDLCSTPMNTCNIM